MITPVYLPEFNQTLKHAKVLAGTLGDGPIYGLVINGDQIASSVILQACYRRFLAENALDNKDSRIRVLPLYTGGFREDHDATLG